MYETAGQNLASKGTSYLVIFNNCHPLVFNICLMADILGDFSHDACQNQNNQIFPFKFGIAKRRGMLISNIWNICSVFSWKLLEVPQNSFLWSHRQAVQVASTITEYQIGKKANSTPSPCFSLSLHYYA